MASPKIKRPPRGRSSELARYLEQCGVPPAPPEDRRRGLEDAATVTRRALAAELRRRKLIPPLRIKPGATEEKAAKAKAKHAKRADDLARLEGWVPEPARSEALAAAAEGHDQVAGGGSPLLGSLLARALLARNAAAAANIRLAIEYALGVDPRGGGAVSRLDPADLVQECMIAVVHTAEVSGVVEVGRAMKAKSYLFRALEGLLKDDGRLEREEAEALGLDPDADGEVQP